MKKLLFWLLLVISAIFFIRFVIGGSEDDWICVEGEWIKHGAPSAPMPEEGCNN